jgi:hypothetical protein
MVCNNNKANHSARSRLIRGGLEYQILLNQEIDNEPLTVIYIYMYLKIIPGLIVIPERVGLIVIPERVGLIRRVLV